MPKRAIILSVLLVGLAGLVLVKHGPGLWGLATATPRAEDAPGQDFNLGRPAGEGFSQVRRHGSVDLAQAYDLSGLTLPEGDIHTLLPSDAIPALTDPATAPLDQAQELGDSDRVVYAQIDGQTLAVPLAILDYHEVVNATLAGQPIALTYCPLCDSATVFSRRVTPEGGPPIVLEFGVSGALYNSNVLFFDRTHNGLWSQLAMQAVSGPLAGTPLEMLPARLTTVQQLRQTHPDARIVTTDTGHHRPYDHSPYGRYFDDPVLMVPVREFGDALPAKTLGIGVALDGQAWFVPAEAVNPDYHLDTPDGPVVITRDGNALAVETAPPGVHSAQTFYYAWSAFYPHTRVIQPQ